MLESLGKKTPKPMKSPQALNSEQKNWGPLAAMASRGSRMIGSPASEALGFWKFTV